jgi:hypothetical protein
MGVLLLSDGAKAEGFNELDTLTRRTTILGAGIVAMYGGPLCCGVTSVAWKILTRLVPLFSLIFAVGDLVDLGFYLDWQSGLNTQNGGSTLARGPASLYTIQPYTDAERVDRAAQKETDATDATPPDMITNPALDLAKTDENGETDRELKRIPIRKRNTMVSNALEAMDKPRQHKGLPGRVVFPVMTLVLGLATFAVVRMVNVLGTCKMGEGGGESTLTPHSLQTHVSNVSITSEPRWPRKWCLRTVYPMLELSQPWLSCACAVMVVRGKSTTDSAVDCDPRAFTRLRDSLVDGDHGAPTISKYLHTLVVQCENVPNVTELRDILGATMPRLANIGIIKLKNGTTVGTTSVSPVVDSIQPAIELPRMQLPVLATLRIEGVPAKLSEQTFDQLPELLVLFLQGTSLTELPQRIFEKNLLMRSLEGKWRREGGKACVCV